MSVRKGGNVIAGVAKGDKFPAGMIAPFAGTAIPEGWLLCDGSAISRTDYADLFNAIGTTYGAGDGSTTFNLPNLINRFIEGETPNNLLYVDAGLPNITGAVTSTPSGFGPSPTGAFYQNGSRALGYANAAVNMLYVYMDASRSSPIYGASTTVQPKALRAPYIIKY